MDTNKFFKPKNIEERKIQYEKELEAECQEKYHMSIDKFKNIYFSFFDQMDEPEKTKAKNNFDVTHAINYPEPRKISDAIFSGFQWGKTPEGWPHWKKIWMKLI